MGRCQIFLPIENRNPYDWRFVTRIKVDTCSAPNRMVSDIIGCQGQPVPRAETVWGINQQWIDAPCQNRSWKSPGELFVSVTCGWLCKQTATLVPFFLHHGDRTSVTERADPGNSMSNTGVPAGLASEGFILEFRGNSWELLAGSIRNKYMERSKQRGLVVRQPIEKEKWGLSYTCLQLYLPVGLILI